MTPETQNTHPSSPLDPLRRKQLVGILAGMVVIATLAFIGGRRSAPGAPTAPVETHREEGDAHGHDEQGDEHADAPGGIIELDEAAARTAGIRVQPARTSVPGESLAVTGTVEVSPNLSATITPPVAGRVVKILVDRGDTVRVGQPVALMDSPEVADAHAAVHQAESGVQQARAHVQTAEAGVQQARTRLQSARSALQRQRQLAETGTFSQPSLQAAQNELNTAEAEERQAQTALLAATTVQQRAERLFKEQLISRAELEQAQTARQQEETRLEQSRKRTAIARQALEREQRIFKGGLLSRQAVQSAEADVRAVESDLKQAVKTEQAARTALTGARKALAAAQDSLQAIEGAGHAGGAGRIVLHAPIGGVVTSRSATLGQAVERATELFAIENLRAVLVDAGVPEADVARVRVGQSVEVAVAAYPNVRFTGVVQSLGGRVNEKTRTLPVRILVQNAAGRLKPEMFARVTLSVGRGTRPVVSVPRSAVVEEGEARFVFVQDDHGYERRAVSLGRTNGDRVEIVKGVAAGEPVVTHGVFVLKSEGAKAELKGHDH